MQQFLCGLLLLPTQKSSSTPQSYSMFYKIMTSKFLLSYAVLAISTLVFRMGNSGSIALLSANPSGTLDHTFNSRDQLLFSCSMPSEDTPKKTNSEDSV